MVPKNENKIEHTVVLILVVLVVTWLHQVHVVYMRLMSVIQQSLFKVYLANSGVR